MRSERRPYSGIPTVMARVYAVMTHAMCSTPDRSPTMVGRAVATIVWSKEDRNITIMRQR